MPTANDDCFFLFQFEKSLENLFQLSQNAENVMQSYHRTTRKQKGWDLVICEQCGWKYAFYSSTEEEIHNTQGRNMQDVNSRAVLAFYEIGTFCISGLTKCTTSRISNMHSESTESIKKAENISGQSKSDFWIKKENQRVEMIPICH